MVILMGQHDPDIHGGHDCDTQCADNCDTVRGMLLVFKGDMILMLNRET